MGWELSLWYFLEAIFGDCYLEDKGEHYESLQDSGSTYTLYKSSERMSTIMAGTFASFKEQLKGNDCTIEVIDSGDYVNNSKGANE